MAILQFSLIALALFYLVTGIYAIIRLVKVSCSKSAIKISIAFYSGMLVAALSRALALYMISINMIPKKKELNHTDAKPGPEDDPTEKALNIFIYLMLVMPDMINVCVYLFLVWYFYAHFILSHINLANDLSLFLKEDRPTISNKTYTLLYIILPGYMIVFTIMCILTFTSSIGSASLYITNAFFNIATPILFFAYYVFLLVKLSGRPYINDQMKNQVTRIFIIVVIWSCARMVK